MGFFKKIKKAFKKVLSSKVFRAVAAVVGVAAAVFTGGASLGLTVGWGAVGAGAASALGVAGTTLGGVVTGAITAAGYGAFTGGVLGLVTGKGFGAGAAGGFLGGALTGGVLGGLGFNVDPFSGIGGDKAAAAPGLSGSGGTDALAGGAGADALGTSGLSSPTGFGPGADVSNVGFGASGANAAGQNLSTGLGVNVPMPSSSLSLSPGAAGNAAGNAATTAVNAGKSGLNLDGMFSQGGLFERNQGLIGSALRGAGQAFLGDDGSDTLDYYRERDQMARDSFSGVDYMPRTRRMTPLRGESQARRSFSSGAGLRYEYDPEQGRVVRREAT